jgi:hypothetical protein
LSGPKIIYRIQQRKTTSMSFVNRTHRALGALVSLALCTSLAWALPSPKQIEDALAAKDYANAKSMVAEVLHEKPANARAHLLNAFIAIHVDHKPDVAKAELKMAKDLDKKGEVSGSALFGRTVGEIDAYRPSVLAQPSPPSVSKVVPAGSFTPAPVHDDGHGVLFYLFWTVLVVVLVIWIARKFLPQPTPVTFQAPVQPAPGYPAPTSLPSPANYGGFGGYPQPQAPVASTGGMGALGTIASVGAGVVAGNLISDAIRGHSNSSPSGSIGTANAGPGYIPFDSTSTVEADSESERASFSSGSDASSWDSGSDDVASSGGSSDWDS